MTRPPQSVTCHKEVAKHPNEEEQGEKGEGLQVINEKKNKGRMRSQHWQVMSDFG